MEQSNIRSRGMTIMIVTGLLIWAFFHSGIRLGQDLKGGTTLRFSLDIEGAKKSGRIAANKPNEEVVEQTIKIIDDRINKFGLSETNLTQYGENKFLISLPSGAANQADGIIDVVSQLGDLKFRIEVKPDEAYRTVNEDDRRDGTERRGIWQNPEPGSFEKWKTAEIALWKKARDRGEDYKPSDKRYSLVKLAGADGSSPNHFHVLEEVNLPYPFDGGILENPINTVDQKQQPVVVFEIRNEFQNVFGQWTGQNIGIPMAIILNEEYNSAPVIQDQLTTNVQITLGRGGSRQAQEAEAKALATVLQTGSLKIRPVLEAKTVMGASLAGESRERGVLSIIVAFVLVLIFMVVYYRASGLIANVALLLNLVMLVGFLAFFQAVLTLPGIAGIVLTVGMAVDANILINERIREERRGGRSLRRAVSEGYDRALSAIIDANVTSIITAIFLYKFGSGPVKGFAITLAIGLAVSMFTAIFVTRTIFEWLMSNGMIKDISAWGSGVPTKVNWIGLKRIFGPLSVIGVVAGLFIFQATDRYTIYDIDFTGGYKIQAEFHDPTTPDEVGKLLATEKRTVKVKIPDFDEDDNPIMREVVQEVGPYKSARVLSSGVEGRSVEIDVQRLFSGSKQDQAIQALAFHEYVSLILEDRLMPDWMLEGPLPFEFVAPEAAPAATDPLEEIGGGMRMSIAFHDPQGAVGIENLRQALIEDLPFWVNEDGRQVPYKPSAKQVERKVVVRVREMPYAGVSAFDVWMKTTTSGGVIREKDPKGLRERLGEYLGGSEFKRWLTSQGGPADAAKVESLALSQSFSSEDSIGSSVAERLKNDAIVALFLSLVGIIIYIGVRFRSRAMGFAAVLCLFHDVAITLGIVAVANSLGIVDAKINLAMVAAFLTLVGYSVNDTVVVFDRIRENRGKRPTLDQELINLSINQTLARTIRTSATFLLVCIALFAFNYGQRNVLEGFAFLLILGSIIGTYSTVAISAPLLLYLPWLWERAKGYAPKSELVTRCAFSLPLIVLTPLAVALWTVWALAFGIGLFLVGLVLFVPWSLGDDGAKSSGPKDPYASRANA